MNLSKIPGYEKLRKLKTNVLCFLITYKSKCQIENYSRGTIKKFVKGKNNKIIIGANTYLDNTHFRIVGNNNIIIIGKNCHIGPQTSFWMEGNNITIKVGDKTTITKNVHINAQENGSKIIIGDDCMLSNTIVIRTSDSHPIYDLKSGKQINQPKDVKIGDHVWIAPNSKIMKGADIGNNSIIGSDTMVTGQIGSSSLAVGHPAKVIKKDVKWTRENIIE